MESIVSISVSTFLKCALSSVNLIENKSFNSNNALENRCTAWTALQLSLDLEVYIIWDSKHSHNGEKGERILSVSSISRRIFKTTFWLLFKCKWITTTLILLSSKNMELNTRQD